ncbi:MAG: phage tail family protein [Tannerella sp.]|jgi:hypothetical protein|nr:phage tail family protein [Tannerella sp.]
MRIDYVFSGSTFSGYGVYVSRSTGLLGRPRRKDPEIYEYPGESGHIPDLATVVYEPRRITLACFILAASANEIISRYEAFTSFLYGQTEVCPLAMRIDGSTKLSFNCYVKELSDISKRFRSGRNAGEFTITFIEPKPYE